MFRLIKLKSGWVYLEIEGIEGIIAISYISDFIGDLVSGVLELENKKNVQVCAELEPNNYLFRFELINGLVIASYWYGDYFEHNENVDYSIIAKITYFDLLKNIKSLLTNSLGSCLNSKERYREEWDFEFPTENYKKINYKIKQYDS